jgi:hypothetical protein
MPEFSGSGAEPNSLITLRSGSTTIATAQADASGNWHSAPILLGAGVFQITASATDAAGNAGAASAARSLIITGFVPPQLPPVPSPRPFASSDPVREAVDNVAPISLAIAGPFGRSPLASTIAQASDNSAMAFGLRQTDFPAGEIRLTLPVDLFGGIELVSIRARLAGGQPLPAWLVFDEARRSLHGELPVGAPSTITVEVIAIDTKGKEHRATVKIGAAVEDRAGAAKAQAAQLPARLSGIDLLAALGLTGVEPAPRLGPADGRAVDGAGQAPAHARHLSDQLARAAQRFAQDSGATLRHLEQIDNQAAASAHA